MEIVTKLDSRRRGVFPPPFQPGDILIKDAQDAQTITFRLLRLAEFPVIRPIRIDGRTMLPRGTASREAIVSAIQAARDAR